ncbi:MAG: glycosyltransferase [Cyanobacteria bacterium P01_C01_bin.72]
MDIIYTKPDYYPVAVTIFAIPKPFDGHIGLIQYNAIASWTKLQPQPEIFLYGDEAGTKEICQELGLIHVPTIQRNEYGTPLLDGIFAQTCDRAKNRIIAYLNADIILMDDFLLGVSSCDRHIENYFLVGRRWDIDIDKKFDFKIDWQSNLVRSIKKDGCLADYDCKDYFVFPKHLFTKIPAFAVGRGYWDTWMINEALAQNYPVVDCSLTITAVHQNHPYIHIRGGRNEAYIGREAQINKSLGNVTQPGNIACATWQLKPDRYRRSPQISIIIVLENDSDAVEKAVLSVLIQDYDRYEIIVVDCRSENDMSRSLKTYQQQIKYYFLAATEEVDAAIFGIEKASGEFAFHLGANSVLLPKVLSRLVDCFTKEASTLDVLLAGYRETDSEVREFLTWQKFPDLEKLHFVKHQVRESLLQNSAIAFRTRRVKLLSDHYLNSKQQLTEIVSNLIDSRGCRVIWFKMIVEHRYIQDQSSKIIEFQRSSLA